MVKRGYISVYVRNHIYGPSCYYRIIQYIDKMSDYRFVVNDGFSDQMFTTNMNLKGSRLQIVYLAYAYWAICIKRLFGFCRDLILKPQIIIIQRETVPRVMPLLLAFLLSRLASSSKIIWDFDDYIIHTEISETERKILEEKSDKIIVTNEYLKSTVDKEFAHKVILMPTTDKTLSDASINEATEVRIQLYHSVVNCVWIGIPGNLRFLLSVFPYIEQAGKELRKNGKSLVLKVITSKDFCVNSDYVKIESIRWSREAVKRELFESHIGIMPLTDNDYTRGKGGFKLIQYMSAAIPVIASPVGYNNEVVKRDYGILADEEMWKDSILNLSSDISKWKTFSKRAYEEYKSRYDYNSNFLVWKELIDSAYGYGERDD